MTPDPAESELLARIRAGDRAACDECIAIHTPEVRRLALRLVRDENEADDLVQETFLRAFRGIGEFDGRSRIGTWLYRIAVNTALMRLRRATPDQVPVDDFGDADESRLVPRALFDWCCLPEPEVSQAEVRAELKRAIDAMPETLRTTFVLRELDGLSTLATAEALGVSEGVVKTRLHRARLWLRGRLTEYFGDGRGPNSSPAESPPD